MKRPLLLALLTLTLGCVYYNGMYNARRLAGRARKAEQEGRTFDATSLWGQVSVRAESVMVKHPASKWADEARLLHGTARARLKDCNGAVQPLEALLATTRDRRLADDAAVVLGDCRVTLGDPVGAAAAYGRLTDSPNAARRSRALYAHGRALRMAGRNAEALDELTRSTDPRARGERAAALAGLGRLPEMRALVESLLVERDSLAPWDSLLAATGRHDLEAASMLLDRIDSSHTVAPAVRARLLLEDASRWQSQDRQRSDQRLAHSLAVAQGTTFEGEARLATAQFQLSQADSVAQLLAVAAELDDLKEFAGRAAPRSAQLAALAHRVSLAADSVPPGSPRGDLRLFLAAEMARDSLAAPRFAARQFSRVADEWPASPFAPKALLALVLLQPAQGDSLRDVLLARYADSPYVTFAQGSESPQYQVLEDSLRRFAMTFRPDNRRGPQPAPNRPQPATPREPVNR